MPQPTWQIQVGLAKEGSWGTGATATALFPILNPKFTVKYEDIFENGYVGNASQDQAYYQGAGQTMIDLPEMMFYPDLSCHFLMGMLGVDTVTGTVNPFTHTLTLLNTALPPSYTLTKYTALTATSERVTGVYFEEVTLKYTNPGKMTISAKGRGKIQDTVTKPALTQSSAGVYLPWQGALTLAGGANAKLIDMTLTLKRPVELIFGMNGAQNPTTGNVGPIEVSGKMTVVPSDTTEFAYYTANTQPVTSIVFTSGTNTLTLQMTKTAFINPTEVDHTKFYSMVNMSFRAIANSTDAGTGNSPLKVIALSPQSAGF